MRVTKVEIHNFRGIRDLSFSMGNYTLLVGANNAGKSTVIDAIRCFYEKDLKYNAGLDKPRGMGTAEKDDGESWIQLAFSLDEQEKKTISEEHLRPDQSLVLRKYFDCKNRDGVSAGVIYSIPSDEGGDVRPYYGAKNVQQGKMGNIIYVPALSKVEEQTKLSGPSALRDFLFEMLVPMVEGNEAYSKLREDIGGFSESVAGLTNEEGHSLSGFNQELSESLKEWETTFNLSFKAPDPKEMVKTMVDWSLRDAAGSTDVDIGHMGTGFQRQFVYHLIRMGSKYLPGRRTSAIRKDFQPNLKVLLFEEPEAFLHPSQQMELAKELRKIANQEGWQVLCTTHSPQFVSRQMGDVPSIVRIEKKAESGSCAYQVGKDAFEKICVGNMDYSKYPLIEERTTDNPSLKKEELRYAIMLDVSRTAMFFAKHVLLVEGPTERAFIQYLVDKEKIVLPTGVVVMDTVGKFNMPRIMRLLDSFGISHAVLCDDDRSRGWHADWNRLVTDVAGETNSPVEFLSPDLEQSLGLAEVQDANDHEKPQLLLAQYANGGIAKDKITEFCKKITPLLSSSSH